MDPRPIVVVAVACAVASGCDTGAQQREMAARSAEQAAREETLAAERRAIEAQKRALEAEKEAAAATDEAATAREEAAATERAQQASAEEANKPRAGRVTIKVDVTFAATKPDGTAWDVLGSLPDPLLVASVASSGENLRSAGAADRLTATTTWDADLAASDSITITAYDGDIDKPDLGGTFTARFAGRAGSQNGTSGAVTFAVTFSAPR